MRSSQAASHWLTQRLAHLWQLLYRCVPVASESKWRGTEELLTIMCGTMLARVDRRDSRSLAFLRATMGRVGNLWMKKRSAPLSPDELSYPVLDALLAFTFKTLDMPTTLHRDGPRLQALTLRCPFLEQATSPEMARRTCDLVCSLHQSLFQGLVKGLPAFVGYLAPRRMGWGDPYCVKEFRGLTPLRLPAEPPTTAISGR